MKCMSHKNIYKYGNKHTDNYSETEQNVDRVK